MNLADKVLYRFVNFVSVILLILVTGFCLLGAYVAHEPIYIYINLIAVIIIILIREGIIYVAYGRDSSFQLIRKMFGTITSPDVNKMKWSEHPGCFESYLKIKFNNPIFPQNKRIITPEDINQAILKDELDTNNIRHKYDVITKESATLENEIFTMEKFDEFRIKIDGLINDVYSAGGINLDILPYLFEARELLVNTINRVYVNSPDVLNALHIAQNSYNDESSKFHNTFMQQYMRKDTPIQKDEIVEVLLSQTLDNFKAFYNIIISNEDSTIVDKLKGDATCIIRSLPRPYTVIPDLDSKMKLLKIGYNEILH
ncbi:hypothetical protein J2N86_15760 (plasmid) [Legionella lytica]|uniref:Uncharacterized protein n=1 Tax=Legionella lytica TaxID=96232 RepID=A0ABY4YDM9_9GAMM|nr:hypothetical protein [Legionella lytica]USQ15601.1 hypothetical protein J2N86_15760 [Legionella lytica]